MTPSEARPAGGAGRLLAVLPILTLAFIAHAGHASAQSPEMNFFVMPEGPTWGADQPAVEVSDTHCETVAYAAGFGHLTWRAYLTGTEADGEADEIARDRIGTGPWYTYYGELIAEDLAQLHSDDNNLKYETVSTVDGEYAPDGFEIPSGSQLDGTDFTREGPYFCFGVPG